MKFILANKVIIEDPTPEVLAYCKSTLSFPNPDYIKREEKGKWTGNTQREIVLYERAGNRLYIPFGECKNIYKQFKNDISCVESRIYPVRERKYGSNINLYDYQKNAVQAVLRAKNGILVAPCGSGKTQMGLEAVARIGGKTLWLTHTQDLLNQSMSRAKECFGLPASEYGTITAGKVNVGNTLTFATVQTASNIDLSQYRDEWDCIVVDECFPKGTKIHTPKGEKELQNLCVGDIITSYNRHTKKIENKPVVNIMKHKAHDIVCIKLKSGQIVFCTKNHPFFVRDKGWISAENLRGNDYVMQLLRKSDRRNKALENGLLSEQTAGMGILLQGMRTKGNCRKKQKELDRRAQRSLFGNDEQEQQKTFARNIRENEVKQSDEKIGNAKKSVRTIKGNRTSPQDTMWERGGVDCSSTNIDVRISKNAGNICGISDTNKNAKRKRLSTLLQGRYCYTEFDDSNRSRRYEPFFNRTSKSRQKENSFFDWVGVESVTFQEHTSDGTFNGVCPDGYVYNIEVADNNNYFANGILVHNCHKCVGSPTQMMMFYRVLSALSARYKIGLTATPYRADGLERCMFALLGDVIHEVPQSEVTGNTVPVMVKFVNTGYSPDVDEITNGDGTLNYSKLIENISEDKKRNAVIAAQINRAVTNGAVLVLSDRIKHLELLEKLVYFYFQHKTARLGIASTKAEKERRARILTDLNNGALNVVFATYKLAKEGLDVPNLRTVVFATPQKDKTTVVQSAGRVARKADGKEFGTVIDFSDDFGLLKGYEKKRKTFYKKSSYIY